MSRPVRVGNAHGFWGDRIEAAAEMLALEPDLDFVTLDFLAEVSMSILATQQSRDPEAGWPRDLADVVRSLVPYWREGGRCRLITNGGGLNPTACARACRQILDAGGCGHLSIAVVAGDNVLDQLRQSPQDACFVNLDTQTPLPSVQQRLFTANAYLGAKPLADALDRGADLIITGRVADPSLTVAACVHYHKWSWDDWDRLAGATVAGHLIECGTQVTGGISTDWLNVPGSEQIGFPIVEVADDGSFIITKPRQTGGQVSLNSVKEQLVYEIGDPGHYLSPDVTVSFLPIQLRQQGPARIELRGAQGRPAPETYKVSATYQDGFRAFGELTVYGANACEKAQRAGQAILNRLQQEGVSFRESIVECLGSGACHPAGAGPIAPFLSEVVLRIAVADESRDSVEKFTRQLMPLITAGPPGTTGYASGRPRVHPVFRYWPCLIPRNRVTPRVDIFPGPHDRPAVVPSSPQNSVATSAPDSPPVFARSSSGVQSTAKHLTEIAIARSGDKGIHANIGLIARCPEDYDRLCAEATVERVAAHLGRPPEDIHRFEFPAIAALNFIVRGILSNSLRVDAQGKTLGQVLLEMPLSNNPASAVLKSEVKTADINPHNDAAVPLPPIIVESVDEATAILTLNRPDRRNALTSDLMRQLCDAIERLAAEPARRILVIRGAGQAFCSGLDLRETSDPDVAEHSADLVARTFRALKSTHLITIALAHSAAFAGGAGLLSCCDFAIASDDLRIGFPEVRRGLIPALVTSVLSDKLPEGALNELFLLGEPITAQKALSMGLVHHVVKTDQLLDSGMALAATLLKAGPEALRTTKRWIHEVRGTEQSHRLTQALKVHKHARNSEEAREGLNAFLERRDPDWTAT